MQFGSAKNNLKENNFSCGFKLQESFARFRVFIFNSPCHHIFNPRAFPPCFFHFAIFSFALSLRFHFLVFLTLPYFHFAPSCHCYPCSVSITLLLPTEKLQENAKEGGNPNRNCKARLYLCAFWYFQNIKKIILTKTVEEAKVEKFVE